MYTEDDDKIVLKNDDSKDDYSDFYTSFNEEKNKNNDKKKKKKSKKAKEEIDLKDEEEFSEFYGTTGDDYGENKYDDKGKKNIRIIIIGGIVLVLIVIIIVLFVGKGDSKQPDIVLMKDNLTINVGESEIISYKIINTTDEIKATFKSSDSDVLEVDENGKITGIDDGVANVIIVYSIAGKENEKKCQVTVVGDGKVDKKITLELTIENGKDNVWTNKDVTIKTKANSPSGIASLQYTFNCEGNDCKYVDIKDDKIFITNPGTTKVLVVAKDKKGEQEEKLVTIKIDKVSPKISFTNPGTITANKETTVCATCKDELSGCKQAKVCKTFTSSKTNQKIIIEDQAGNQVSSSSFNVTITKDGPICTLSLSSDGVVTAKVNSDAAYFGFNDSYSGTNETSKKIEISASKKGESGALVVNYYVKNKNGSGGKCFLTVVKECYCTDTTVTDDNCPVTCKYSSR